MVPSFLRSALKSSSRSPSPIPPPIPSEPYDSPSDYSRVPVPPSPSTSAPTSLPSTPPTYPHTDLASSAPKFTRTASSPPLGSTTPTSSPGPRHATLEDSAVAKTKARDPGSRSGTASPKAHVPHLHLPPSVGLDGAPLQSAMHHHTEFCAHSRTPSDEPGTATTNASTVKEKPYTPKVSFDTFENPLASMFSFTLQVKSAGYKRTRNTRVYLCAASTDESGVEALDWCLESLVQDGDEVIIFRGVDEEVLEKDHDILRDDAREFMRVIQAKSAEADPDRKLSLILEYIPGKITDTIDRLIALYRPDSLVVGTRGKRGLMANVSIGLGGIGSVSKYCLSHSPVPVIVVRPERKAKKEAEKRKADPKRGTHFD
ncbi:hypothetical protein MD484_g4177, partial [Candolleomyces efflorescens]